MQAVPKATPPMWNNAGRPDSVTLSEFKVHSCGALGGIDCPVTNIAPFGAPVTRGVDHGSIFYINACLSFFKNLRRNVSGAIAK